MRDIEPGSGAGKRDRAEPGSGTGPLLAIWASKKSPDLAISDLSRFPPTMTKAGASPTTDRHPGVRASSRHLAGIARFRRARQRGRALT